MISRIKTGSYVRGMVNYNADRCKDEKEGRFLGTRNIFGDHSAKNIISTISRRNSLGNIEKPNLHISLSFHKDDILSDIEMQEIAERYMIEMGFSDSPMAIYRHTDKEHPHLHIVSTQISPEGKKINDSYIKYRSKNIVEQIEKDYGITVAKKTKEQKFSKDPINEYLNGEKGLIKSLSDAISIVLRTKPINEKEYSNRLHKMGVELFITDRGYSYSILLDQDQTKKYIYGSDIDSLFTTKDIKMQLSAFSKERQKAAPQFKAISHLIFDQKEAMLLSDIKKQFNKKGFDLLVNRRNRGEEAGKINGFSLSRKKDGMVINLSELGFKLKDVIPKIIDNLKNDYSTSNEEKTIQTESTLETPSSIPSNSKEIYSLDKQINNLLNSTNTFIDLILEDNAVAQDDALDSDKIKKRKKRKRRR